ncbi:MAG: hypothetical protein JWP42_1573 [Pseudomonas sp.]|nr:hypothetical protein [Pseudomonas sp.]
MFIDEDRLKPYLDAVKKARTVRNEALRQLNNFDDDSRDIFLRADAQYRRACKELADVAEAFVQGA